MTWRIGVSVFRRNLACFTGILPPVGPPMYDAHHVFPQKFSPEFNLILGPRQNLIPQYGQWWYFVEHQALAQAYNKMWGEFFAERPHLSPAMIPETLDEGRRIMRAFRQWTYF
jgi:hypothetical protein